MKCVLSSEKVYIYFLNKNENQRIYKCLDTNLYLANLLLNDNLA